MSNKMTKNKKIAIALLVSIPVVVAGVTTGIVFGVKANQKSNTHIKDPGESVKTHEIDTNQYTYELELDKEYQDDEVSVNLLFNNNDNNITWSKVVVGNILYVKVKAKEGSYENDLTYNFSLNVKTSEWNETITGFKFVVKKTDGRVGDKTWAEAINDLLKDDENFTISGKYIEQTIPTEGESTTKTYNLTSKYDSNVSEQTSELVGSSSPVTYYFDYLAGLYWFINQQNSAWVGNSPTVEKFGRDEFYDTLLGLEELKDKSTSEMTEVYDSENQCFYYKGSVEVELPPYKYTTIGYGWWFDKSFHIAKSEIRAVMIRQDDTVIVRNTAVDYTNYDNTHVTLPYSDPLDIERQDIFKANFNTNDNCFKVTIPERGMAKSNSYYAIYLDLEDPNIPDTFTINTLRGEYVGQFGTVKKEIDYSCASVDNVVTESTIKNDVVTYNDGIIINKSQLPRYVNFILYSDAAQPAPFTFYLETAK